MASIFTALQTRVSKKARAARRDHENDYSAHFEELKAMNAERVRRISDTSSGDTTAPHQHYGYDDVAQRRSTMTGSGSTGSIRSSINGRNGGGSEESVGTAGGNGARTPPRYEDVIGAHTSTAR